MPHCEAAGNACRCPYDTTSSQQLLSCSHCQKSLHARCSLRDENQQSCCPDCFKQRQSTLERPSTCTTTQTTDEPVPKRAKTATKRTKRNDSNDIVIDLNIPLNDAILQQPHPSTLNDEIVSPFDKNSRRTTAWWIAFHRYVNDRFTANCNVCGQRVCIGENFTPSALREHLKRRHTNVYEYLLQKKKEQHDPRAVKRELAAKNRPDLQISDRIINVEYTKPHPQVDPALLVSPFAPGSRCKALWWKAFHSYNNERPENEGLQQYACCNICAKAVARGGDNSTSPLMSHLFRNHWEIYLTMCEEKGIQPVTLKQKAPPKSRTALKTPNTETKRPPRDAITAACHWAVQTSQPWSVFDHPTFQEMIASQSSFLTSETVQACLDLSYDRLRTRLQAVLDTKTELVLSRARIQGRPDGVFRIVQAHWIDKIAGIQSALLDVQSVDALENTMGPLVGDFDIDLEKQVEFTVSDDNAPNTLPCLDEALEELASVALLGVDHFGSDGDQIRLTRIRNLVSRVLASTEIIPKLEPKKHPLVEDSIQRWWSTLSMIEGVLDCKEFLESLPKDCVVDSSLEIQENDWKLLNNIKDVLEPFRFVQETLDGQKSATAPLIPFILNVVKERLEKNASSEEAKVRRASRAMLERFDSILEGVLNKQNILAHVLDPRFKYLPTLKSETAKQDVWDDLFREVVQMGIRDMGKEAEKASSVAANKSDDQEKNDGSNERMDIQNAFDDPFAYFDQLARHIEKEEEKRAAVPLTRSELEVRVRRELAGYKEEKAMPFFENRADRIFNDPLMWWKNNKDKYPSVWRVAKVYLSLPATASGPRLAMNFPENSTILSDCQKFANTRKKRILIRHNYVFLKE